MNAKLRDISVRYRSVFWLAAIALAAIEKALGLSMDIWVGLIAAMAAVASVNGAILDTHRDGMETLIRELARVSQQRPDGAAPAAPHLRRAR